MPLRVFLGRLRLSLYSSAALALLGALVLLQLIGSLTILSLGSAPQVGPALEEDAAQLGHSAGSATH